MAIYKFEAANHYIDYKLYEHLQKINSYVFHDGYSFLTEYSMPSSSFNIEYYDEYPNVITYPNTQRDSKGTLVKVIPYTPSDVNYFQNNTYINIVTPTGKYKTLIIGLVPNEYFIIETYKSSNSLIGTALSLDTIYNLKEISDILYNVYINDETPTNTLYYRIREDNMRRNIFNGYANFISQDLGIINNTTAFLMQDKDNKFILKIYDPENISNGGTSRVPYVITKANLNTTSTSASLPGEVISDNGSSITSVGICYGTDPNNLNMCLSGDTILLGPFIMYPTNLSPVTTYYYRAYAKNEQGTGYGEIYSFNTLDPIYTPPVVITKLATPTSHYITVDSEIIDKGYSTITQRGVVYKLGVSTPIISDNPITYIPESGEVGSYSIIITGLTHNTIYSYNSFATNAICGTTLGDSGYTSTLYPSPPVLETVGYENLDYDRFDAIFNLVSNDGPIDDPIHGVNEMGIVLNTDFNNPPTVYDNKIGYTSPYSIGQFSVNLTGLSYDTTYYYRAFATNTLYSGDTAAYGTPNKWVNTLPLPTAPIVSTSILSYFTYSANTSNIVSDGGSPITSKGLYYAQGDDVTISNDYLSATGTTNWHSNITGLTPSTLYSVMATATNAFGTSYSAISGFTTMPILTSPVVAITYITTTDTTSTLTGNVIDDGNVLVTSRGILYSGVTTGSWLSWPASPLTGEGLWTSTINGLTNNNLYYAKAFATNSIGTSYSNEVNWTTTSGNLKPSFSADSPVIIELGINTASIKNDIVNNGGATVFNSGLDYSGATLGGWLNWYDGTNIGTFYNTITGLTEGNTYYVYAYAENSEGITYTPTTEFITPVSTIPTIVITGNDTITNSGARIYSDITNNGYQPILYRGFTGDTVGNWVDTSGLDEFTTILTGLTAGTYFTGQSYATNIVGTGWSNNVYFRTLASNNATINLTVSSASSLDPYVYQVGTLTSDIVTEITINRNSIPLSELWSGLTYFPSVYGTPSTGLTWGLSVTSADNRTSPYTYYPTVSEITSFEAIESCGIPSEIKIDTKPVYAVYPFLTCNRVPIASKPIPDPSQIAFACGNGSFYNGSVPPNYEPMLKKVEVKSNKAYVYSIGASNNLVYFAYPSSYGLLTSIVAGGITLPMSGPGSPTLYPNVTMLSAGLPYNWSTSYHVYAFMVTINRAPGYFIEYNF